VKTVRTECLEHFVIFGQRHLRHLLKEFCAHYHTERYHQGLGGRLIQPRPSASNDTGYSDRSCAIRVSVDSSDSTIGRLRDVPDKFSDTTG
jgi:hypothetical protein